MDRTWQEFLRDIEQVRAVTPGVGMEMRADDDDDESLGTMTGHFSVFNVWYEIDSLFEGRFLERTAPGAFAKTIAESRDAIKVLYDHGHDWTVGNKILGPIRELHEDGTGPYYEVSLDDTSYNRDLLPGLRQGLYGSSFRFRVIKDEWNDEPEPSDHNPQGLPERTIKEVRVFEFGPVTFPANPDATAGVRSMTDDFYDRLRERNPDRYDQLLARAREFRTPDPGAATHRPEPQQHSDGPTQAQRMQIVRRKRLEAKGLMSRNTENGD